LNPTWPDWPDKADFGTQESVELFEKEHADLEDEIRIPLTFEYMLNGWCHEKFNFRGMLDFGTISGYSNKSLKSSYYKQENPLYGVHLIMKEMILADIFPQLVGKRTPFDYCAINNVIKCAGKLKNCNPTKIMKEKCDYYQEELKRLKPETIIVMGGDAHKYINKRYEINKKSNELMFLIFDGKEIPYWALPHPLNVGHYTWLGNNVKNLCEKNILNREYNKNEEKRYGNQKLFNFICSLIYETKKFSHSSNQH